MIITAHTDGACSINPGPGGWAFVIQNDYKTKECSGYEPFTTNNRMELTAVLEAMLYFEKYIVKDVKRAYKYRLDIYSDSAYVVNSVKKGWLNKWQHNGYKKTDGGSIQNIDIWQQIYELLKKYNINVIKIKGHNGDKYNEKVDKLAKLQIVQNKEVT